MSLYVFPLPIVGVAKLYPNLPYYPIPTQKSLPWNFHHLRGRTCLLPIRACAYHWVPKARRPPRWATGVYIYIMVGFWGCLWRAIWSIHLWVYETGTHFRAVKFEVEMFSEVYEQLPSRWSSCRSFLEGSCMWSSLWNVQWLPPSSPMDSLFFNIYIYTSIYIYVNIYDPNMFEV